MNHFSSISLAKETKRLWKGWGPSKKFFIQVLLLFCCSSNLMAQNLKGIVFEKKSDGKTEALVGATVRWLNAKTGIITNLEGKFELPKKTENHQLVVSFVGYRADTFMVHSLDYLTVVLQSESNLQEVTVRSTATSIDRLNPIKTEILTTKALAKAACCNLSESFETNASVSVSYSDAITGTKQIQMLGLAGQYVQINTENIPTIRGLNNTFGLNYIPGTWVTSIDVSKGVGSVVNGPEAMAGAINVELAKPDAPEKLYLNSYFNSFGRGEINLNLAKKINNKWSLGLLTHGSTLQTRLDKNKDGFLDLPLFSQVNGVNRWKYQTERWMAQFGVKALYEDRLGGQSTAHWNKAENFVGKPVYAFGSTTKRVEFFSKTAQLFPEKPYKGIGLIINALAHQNDSYFGYRNYSGKQQSLYGNLIYQNIIGTTTHSYKIGSSFLLDDYTERYTDSSFVRREVVPGIFGEYTLAIPEKVTLVLGGRVDFHNLFGTIFTPRAHVLFHLPNDDHLRLSAGKGWRTPNSIAENFGMLVNSRALVFTGKLQPEEAWNFGAGYTHEFELLGQPADLSLDYYYTDFQRSLIVDMENSQYIRMYYGVQTSHSFQVEANVQPIKNMEIKLAYRRYEVKNDIRTFGNETTLLPKMFVNPDRVLFNIGYATKFEKWKFDFTWQWNGKRRIPDFSNGHVHSASATPVYASAFSNINAQVTKNFKTWAMYVGGENLGNYTQTNPILGSNDPFGSSFDASMVWAPVIGRMVYVGMRYKIKS
ncbi:MAG: carboxypeptidase-like regulatory domain-containing protein [Spirosomataceae bacterium]